MANQTKETKDKLAYNQKDAKEIKQKAKKEPMTSKKPSANIIRGKCPPGQTRNPETGQCE